MDYMQSDSEMSEKWLKHAHYDENIVVDEFWKKGYPALRLPVVERKEVRGEK
jgi:hypothetical protein